MLTSDPTRIFVAALDLVATPLLGPWRFSSCGKVRVDRFAGSLGGHTSRHTAAADVERPLTSVKETTRHDRLAASAGLGYPLGPARQLSGTRKHTQSARPSCAACLAHPWIRHSTT